jgi:tetratricopeptide (TPR) repeat protein
VLSRSLELDVPSAPPVGLERGTLPETVFPASPRVPEFTSHEGSSASALRRPLPETGSAPEAAKALGAQMAFHRAESQLVRGNLEHALREAKAALDYDPAKPEHIALHAYLLLLQPGADPRHALSEFDRAIERLEAGIKVHWYRGLALKRLDRHASALREFRAVLEEDPHHIDAAREVHIYEERLRRSPKERPSLAPEPERRPSVILDWAKKLKG